VNREMVHTQLLVECLAQMALVLLEQKGDAPAAVVEAGAGASESGDVMSTAIPSLLRERGLVKGQEVAQ